jgi:hypothetical protein
VPVTNQAGNRSAAMTAPKLKTRDGSDLYDQDFYAWTQDQAQRLRTLSGQDRVDTAHLAEEVEDLGKREKRELESHLQQCLAHLLKLAVSPAEPPRRHWFDEVIRKHDDGLRVLKDSPGLRQLLDLDQLWSGACRRANRDLAKYDEPGVPADLPCTFQLDELLGEEFDLRVAESRIRESLR